MREIVLDTETTGFEPETGDRIVEIGAVELVGHLPTGNTFHVYVNPERAMPEAAFAVHGLGDDFLRDKPVFAAVARDFLDFVGDARLVIHNAGFDMKFLNHELGRLGHPAMPMDRATDTVMMARRKFPGAPASLDALCRRFGIDNSGRTLHGALLDSQLLAEVYLELIGGRQPDFGLGAEAAPRPSGAAAVSEAESTWRPKPRPRPLPPRITPEEEEAHAALVAALGAGAVWLRP
jgi:DNA polymerase-3 subunit epsilon